jgi:hypothetical protein
MSELVFSMLGMLRQEQANVCFVFTFHFVISMYICNAVHVHVKQ